MDQLQKQNQNMLPMQRLMMLPKMQQALHILQMPSQELSQYMELFLSDNPLATKEEREIEENEFDEKDDDLEELNFTEHDLTILENINEEVWEGIEEHTPSPRQDEEKQAYIETLVTNKPSLYHHLMQQAREHFANEKEVAIAEVIIGNLDDHGFFSPNWNEWQFLYQYSKDQITKILHIIQCFEPCGIAATSLQDSFLIQLRNKGLGDSLAFKVVQSCYDDLLHNRILQIQKKLKCAAKLDLALRQIQALDRNPAASFRHNVIQTVTPDVEFVEVNGKVEVHVLNQHLPEIHINKRYLRMIEDPNANAETKSFINEYLTALKWLMKNIAQRSSILERMSLLIAEKQKTFLTSFDGKIVPMTMKEIAQELGVNESTISRIVGNKYFSSMHGTVPFSMLFSRAKFQEELSSMTIQKKIGQLIENEDRSHPLSDAKIASMLQSEGITCARRTIAKYRELLKIGNRQQRKRYY